MFAGFRRHRNSTIVEKTATRVTAVFLLAMILMAAALNQLHTTRMRERIISDKQELITEVAKGIDAVFDTLNNPLYALANQSSVKKLLRDDLPLYGPEWLKCIRDIEINLSKIHIYYDYIVELAIINPESHIMYSQARQLNFHYDFVNSAWFQEALEQENTIKYAPPHGSEHFYSRYRDVPNLFSLIYPLESNGKIQGYILCEVESTRISHLFHDSAMGLQEGYLLIDSAGSPIFDYRQTRPPEQMKSMLNSARMDRDSENFVTTYDDNLYVCRRLESTGWYVVSEIENRVLWEPLQAILWIVLVIVAVACGLSILVMLRITGKLQKPINDLLERISGYDGTASVALPETRNEYGELTVIRGKFEEMADKINTLINDIYVARLHQRDMELEMLVNQINPHFLYNVLQSIHGEAVLQGNRRIEDMIAALSEMLRYTINRDRDMVTVEEEVRYTRNYLDFYKTRFPDMFQYSITCDPELLDCPILKFLLQPVAENSIKHGFRDKKQGGFLSITVAKQERNLVFTVRDNGNGIPPNQLTQLQGSLSGSYREPGVGIANTEARIKLKYGERYGMQLESRCGEYTQVCILIPLDPAPQDVRSSWKEGLQNDV